MITLFQACKQSATITEQNFKTKRQSFDHYSACQWRSLRKLNLIAIE